MLTLFNSLPILFFLLTFTVENIFGFSLTNIRGMSLNNFSIYMLLIALPINSFFTKKLINHNNLNIFLALITFYLFLSIPIKHLIDELNTEGVLQDILAIKQWIEPWLLFFVFCNIINNKKIMRITITGCLIVLVISIMTMLLNVFNIVTIGAVRTLHEGRAAGLAEPNQYAAALVLFLPLILTFLIINKTLFVRTVSGFLCLITIIALLCTGSRGGFIALGFSTLTYIYFLWKEGIIKKRNILVLCIIFSLGFSFSFAVLPENFQKSLKQRLNPSFAEDVAGYTSGRTTIWISGVQLFLDSPIYGHGIHTFKPLLIDRFYMHNVSHNDYLMYLVEFGIIGLLFFVMIYIQIFRHTLVCIHNTENNFHKFFYISYVCGLVGYVVCLFGVNLYNPIRIIFWIYTAVVYRYVFIQNRLESK
jgi:teichuronic acid biosynthesis protein TuaE